MSRILVNVAVRHFADGRFVSRPDIVAGEEPLEIRLGGRPFTVTMRTPGHDVELVHGLLLAEGIISAADDVLAARYCAGADEDGRNTYNVMDVELARPLAAAEAIRSAVRTASATSACGVCGKASIDALRLRVRHPLCPGPRLNPEVVAALPGRLRQGQRAFARTGGLHAAALADANGQLDEVREDVGRHNAVDKVIGAALMAGRIPATDRVLVTSSRASFELVQKAILAGIGMLVAVSAPSSLAVELAVDAGLTLVGFTRQTSFNVYSAAGRVGGD